MLSHPAVVAVLLLLTDARATHGWSTTSVVGHPAAWGTAHLALLLVAGVALVVVVARATRRTRSGSEAADRHRRDG